MAKKRKSRKQQMIEKKNKAEEKRMLYWAVGINARLFNTSVRIL